MNYQEIYAMFYAASMKAIALTGDAYKELSWFPHNKKKAEESEQDNKKAA